MRRHLVVQMAEEYYNSQDYGKALTYVISFLTIDIFILLHLQIVYTHAMGLPN